MPKKSSRVVNLGPVVTQDIGGVNQSAKGALGTVSGGKLGKKKGKGPISRSQYRVNRASS